MASITRWAFWSCVLLWDETRKQNPCIPMADRAMLVRSQAVVGVQLGGEDAATSAGTKGSRVPDRIRAS